MADVLVGFHQTEHRIPAGAGAFLYTTTVDRLWGLHSLLFNGYWGSFPAGKAVEV